MRRLLLALVATVSLAACVQPTRAQVITALTDAQWGLAAGCVSTWVPADDCQIATDGLTAAIAIAQSAPASEVKPKVVAALQSFEVKLGANAKTYIDYLVAFLG